MVEFDDTVSLLREGYGWLPNLRRRSPDGVARTRLLGRRVVGVCGPEAARWFADEQLVRRTRPDHGSPRAAMFLSLINNDQRLAGHTAESWDETVNAWTPGQLVVIFDEAAKVLTRGACRWAGIPVSPAEVPALAAELVAVVDGSLAPSLRYWRARAARRRCEEWFRLRIADVWSGRREAASWSIVCRRDEAGRPLDPGLAAAELVNVLQPTVALAWFVAFAAHAMHRWPDCRERLTEPGGPEGFVNELRRFYPFLPFLTGKAIRDLPVARAGSTLLFDVYGYNHDPERWDRPYRFDPTRRQGPEPHCPGEAVTVLLLRTLVTRLAALEWRMPHQNLHIPLSRIPTLPVSGLILQPLRGPAMVEPGRVAESGRRGN
ncbi:cytochrome P450 [Acrocarpospora catenulata]|uniref:cytochrome P450 n=1 Tax=Acrocarpospora catenulata TaxID=2836182 RepID=UPI0020239B9C|nr:cytochrome P450 [Acrocarpospora catenulata]